ncbi:MAG: flagellar hook-associated protein FlgL [Legionellaceae bacterium]|nr:flagellar hook-associated protein FlgL [Legionellaceae bacterium]
MRISSNQIFLRGLNNMQTQQAQVLKLQQQLSSGKKIETPADDPIAAARIDLMKMRIDHAESLQQNRQSAEGTLRFEEGILSNSVAVLQRLRDLQIQAGNDGMSSTDREAIAVEASNLLEQLQGLANTQDSNGYYIFSGSKSNTQTITRSADQFFYNGDETRRYQDITSGLQIALSDTGQELFMRIANGNGDFSVRAHSNNGTISASSGSVFDRSAYVEDEYTLNIMENSAGEKVVMVTGANEGDVLPLSGDVDDAPLYQSGEAIRFNGLEITLRGNPDIGDGFTIAPSVNESVFSTVSRMVNNLRQPFDSSVDKARVQTENNQILEQLDNAFDTLLGVQADIGARLNQLDVADKINEDLIFISRNTLMQLENVDMAETAVALNLQMVYLQAAQQSFGKIQGLTVFNYL